MWIENNTDKKECFRMDMVAVLIPCYNEAKTIEKVVKDYLKVLPENSKIYVYDNEVKAREYMSYISEKAGGFCCAGRTGKQNHLPAAEHIARILYPSRALDLPASRRSLL